MKPVVDLGRLIEVMERKQGAERDIVTIAQDNPEVKVTARHLKEVMDNYGYCYLDNHGVPQHVLDAVFTSAKEFFALDTKVKDKYIREDNSGYGWIGLEREKSDVDSPYADMKESYDFSPTAEQNLSGVVPTMDNTFGSMFDRCRALSHCILDLIALTMDFKDPNALREQHGHIGKKASNVVLRSLYYPPCRNISEGQAQCGLHTDFGTITLLFPDNTGGLQVVGKDGTYIDVTPFPGKVVMIMGEMIQRFTSDNYPATLHRVVVPPRAVSEGRARQSFAFFCRPDDDVVVQCLDGSESYPPLPFLDFLTEKFAIAL